MGPLQDFVQQEIFPLSSKQEIALAAEGVIRLTSGDYQFAAKVCSYCAVTCRWCVQQIQKIVGAGDCLVVATQGSDRWQFQPKAQGVSFSLSPVPPVQYIQRIVRVGGCPAVMAQWQSTGGSSQRCPGFDSQRLLAFFTFLYFRLITSKFIYSLMHLKNYQREINATNMCELHSCTLHLFMQISVYILTCAHNFVCIHVNSWHGSVSVLSRQLQKGSQCCAHLLSEEHLEDSRKKKIIIKLCLSTIVASCSNTLTDLFIIRKPA